MPEILESGGARRRSSLHRSRYSTSPSPSSSRRMLEAETMEEERREVREEPLELESSDMGDMQEDRPDMELMPLSLWEWLCRGEVVGSPDSLVRGLWVVMVVVVVEVMVVVEGVMVVVMLLTPSTRWAGWAPCRGCSSTSWRWT